MEKSKILLRKKILREFSSIAIVTSFERTEHRCYLEQDMTEARQCNKNPWRWLCQDDNFNRVLCGCLWFQRNVLNMTILLLLLLCRKEHEMRPKRISCHRKYVALIDKDTQHCTYCFRTFY